MTQANMTMALPNVVPNHHIQPGAFGEMFVYSLIQGNLIGPVVPSYGIMTIPEGANYASEHEQEMKPIDLSGISPERAKLIPTLWTGTDGILPPNWRPLPRQLIIGNAIPCSPADDDAMGMMEVWHDLDSAAREDIDGKKAQEENKEPSFYEQLRFIKDVMGSAEAKLTKSARSRREAKETAKRPYEIMSSSELIAIKERLLGSCVAERVDLSLVRATILALGNRRDMINAAAELREASLEFEEQGLVPLSAIALDAARDIYIAADGIQSSESLELGYSAAKNYYKAISELQKPEQDPIGFWTMFKRGFAISMTDIMRSVALGRANNSLLKIGHAFSTLAIDLFSKSQPKEVATSKARLVWFMAQRAHGGGAFDWDIAMDLMSSIASHLAESGDEANANAVYGWSMSANEFAK